VGQRMPPRQARGQPLHPIYPHPTATPGVAVLAMGKDALGAILGGRVPVAALFCVRKSATVTGLTTSFE